MRKPSLCGFQCQLKRVGVAGRDFSRSLPTQELVGLIKLIDPIFFDLHLELRDRDGNNGSLAKLASTKPRRRARPLTSKEAFDD